MGIMPFKETPPGRFYVGHHIYQGVSNYPKGKLLPLEGAIKDPLLQLLPPSMRLSIRNSTM
jgi:hypothetical protein